MTTNTRPAWRRVARILVLGALAKFVIVGAAYWLAMDMLHAAAPL